MKKQVLFILSLFICIIANAQTAKTYYEKAFQGDPESQNMLGRSYDQGWAVRVDHDEAAEWYLKAAEQGDASAQWNLALYYYDHSNYDQATKWFTLAAEQGQEKSIEKLKDIKKNAPKTTKAEYKAALKEIKHYPKAAKKGTAQDKFNYAYYLCCRGNVSIEAVEWLHKAAEEGHAKAQKMLGDCYYYGRGIDKNIMEAVVWYKKSADQRYVEAQNKLASCYYNGYGVDIDYVKAVNLWDKVVEQTEHNTNEKYRIYHNRGD